MRLVRIRRRGRHARGQRLAHPGQAGERVVGIGGGGAAAIGNGGVVTQHIIGRLRCQSAVTSYPPSRSPWLPSFVRFAAATAAVSVRFPSASYSARVTIGA